MNKNEKAGVVRRKFIDLPLGARFQHKEGGKVFVVLERHGRGKVAEADVSPPWQGIYSAASTERECKDLDVLVAPAASEVKA